MFEPLAGNIALFQLHCLNPERYPFLLQSTAPNARTGRYDILFAFPQQRLSLRQGALQYLQNEGRRPLEHTTFLQAFDALWKDAADTESVHSPEFDALPFKGGWFLYLGYELAHEIEPTLLPIERPDADFADAYAVRIPAAIIYDHQNKQTVAVAEEGYADAMRAMQEDWHTLSLQRCIPSDKKTLKPCRLVTEEAPEHYRDGVKIIKKYIVEGDVFQVNYSRKWQYTYPDEGYQALYSRMRSVNPAPFSGMAKFDDYVIASMSPERLLKTTAEGTVELRPIAGTRPRGDNAVRDAALSQELLQHSKEQAEHIMLLDLERNDLGRVCEPGSIHVSEMMTLESYATVHHIVSNVQGTLRQGVTPSEVIAAVFPGGTITGCPKVRCMEIIAELEQEARQAYTGSMGYVNHDGSMDLNILIRTMLIHNERVTFRAGAGIVHDSIAQNELEETRAKARGMINVLQADE